MASVQLKEMPTPKNCDIKTQEITHHCKFGGFVTQPSGLAVNTQNDIIIVNTGYMIKLFDKNGRFKLQFSAGDEKLQPSSVAVCKKTGDILVTEGGRSHQVRVYSKQGKVVRKFGANILQQPNAVCIDSEGRVIVVDCKMKWLVIFDRSGNLLKLFGCSQYLQFPNGVATNDKQEIFISDYRAHCVMVFDYDGKFIRKIGGEGVTKFPGGVGINTKGEVIVADNHKNFHVTVFSQDGLLISALESNVKHVACQGLAVMDDGNVVLASQEETNKKFYLYIYKSTQVQPSPPTPRYSTSPFPCFEDQLSYVCVTNDEHNMGGFIQLPLCPDYSLSASTLKKAFPEATGLYYYSADNLILGVFQNEEKHFPPRSGDTILYITKKMSNLAQTDFIEANEGSDSRKRQLVSPVEIDISDLKQSVDEMRLAMNQMRREISELKEEQNFFKSDSVLDVNANIFEPAIEADDARPIAAKGDKTYDITAKETEDDTIHDDSAKNTVSEDAAKDAIAEVGTKKNDNRANTLDQAWQLQGITASYNPSLKEASNPVVRGTKGESLCQTEEYRREKIRLQSSDSSPSGAGSSLSGDSFMSLKRLSTEQESVKPQENVESQHVSLHLGHNMGGVNVGPDLQATVSYKTSEDRCFSVTGDKAVDVNSLRLPTKARGRNIKILKGVKNQEA